MENREKKIISHKTLKVLVSDMKCLIKTQIVSTLIVKQSEVKRRIYPTTPLV
jgi:hypothetical protein